MFPIVISREQSLLRSSKEHRRRLSSQGTIVHNVVAILKLFKVLKTIHCLVLHVQTFLVH